jgi:hypothetical protein
VVAASTAVPARAASATCPNLSAPWTSHIPLTGSVDNSTGATGWNNQSGSPQIPEYRFWSVGDPTKNTGSANVDTLTTFEAVAGQTYTFTFNAAARLANPQPAANQRLDLYIGGALVQQWMVGTPTAGTTQLSAVQGSWIDHTLTVTWTATSTGTVPFRFNFGLYGTSNGLPTCNDIGVTLPIVTC